MAGRWRTFNFPKCGWPILRALGEGWETTNPMVRKSPLAPPQVVCRLFPSRAHNRSSRKSEAQMTTLQSPMRAILSLFPVPYSQVYFRRFFSKNPRIPTPSPCGNLLLGRQMLVTYTISIACILVMLTNQYMQTPFSARFLAQKEAILARKAFIYALTEHLQAPQFGIFGVGWRRSP